MLNHEWCKSRQDHGIKNHKKDSRLLTIIQPNLPNRLCRQCISKSTVHYKHNHGVKKFIESHLILIWLHFYKSFTNCLAYLIILITFSFSRLCVYTLHSLTGCGLAWRALVWLGPTGNDLAGSRLKRTYVDMHGLTSVVQWNMVSWKCPENPVSLLNLGKG